VIIAPPTAHTTPTTRSDMTNISIDTLPSPSFLLVGVGVGGGLPEEVGNRVPNEEGETGEEDGGG